MSVGEFQLIDHYFARCGSTRRDIVVGVGDDGALLDVPADHRVLTTAANIGVDDPWAAPQDGAAVGHHALARAMLRLAATGAAPAWASLALTVPCVDETWLSAMSGAMSSLAQSHGVGLVGGDTTRGPGNATVMVAGLIPLDCPIGGAGARPGDRIAVSGSLAAPTDDAPAVAQTMRRLPDPRSLAGVRARGIVSAAEDLLDGLPEALQSMLGDAALGARVERSGRHLSAKFAPHSDPAHARRVRGSYELCFAVPPEMLDALREQLAAISVSLTDVGTVESAPGIRARDAAGRPND